MQDNKHEFNHCRHTFRFAIMILSIVGAYNREEVQAFLNALLSNGGKCFFIDMLYLIVTSFLCRGGGSETSSDGESYQFHWYGDGIEISPRLWTHFSSNSRIASLQQLFLFWLLSGKKWKKRKWRKWKYFLVTTTGEISNYL